MKQGFNNYIIALIHACMFSPVYLYLLLNTKEMVLISSKKEMTIVNQKVLLIQKILLGRQSMTANYN